MKFVINTIVRNRRPHLESWRDQIFDLVDSSPGDSFDLVVVENNSIDGSKQFLGEMDTQRFANSVIKRENFPSPHYGSVKDKTRVEILATQRNKALDLSRPYLTDADKIIFIEPDIVYNPRELLPLLHSDADVISPRSTQAGCEQYDSWSVRRTPDERDCYEIIRDEKQVYATWCQFCVCNAQPIVDHCIRFSGFNHRLRTWDNDVACFVEEFHRFGHHDIRINGRITVDHKHSH